MCSGLQKIIKAAGGQRLAGEIVGVTQPAVAAWLAAGEVPYEKAFLYSRVFDMDIRELCPARQAKTDALAMLAADLSFQYRHLRRRLSELEHREAVC